MEYFIINWLDFFEKLAYHIQQQDLSTGNYVFTHL